jgi:sugar lactone lactonase YvrE
VSTPLRDATRDVRAVAVGIDHPEGVAWHDGHVYCGTEGGELLRIDPASGSVEVASRPGGFLLGLAFDGAGHCVVCDAAAGRLVRVAPDGSSETLLDSVGGRKLVSPNFPAFASDGTLWVTESGSSWTSDDGYLFRVGPGGEAEIADEACRRFPNGLALAPDESRLYVVESRWPGVSSYPLRDGILGEREETLPLPLTVPDGLAFDAGGALFIGCCRPDRVYRLSSSGALEIYLDDFTGEFMTTPTNLAFGGDGLRTLFLAGLAGWSVNAIETEVAGHPPPRPG